jgi:choline dehydrogenase
MWQPSMDAYRGEVIQPVAEIQTDDQIDAFVRESVDSAYHPAGTCKIGVDAMAVVGPDLRVRGLGNLRIIDSSVFPTVPNGNLNGPTMMVAERGADIIKGVTEPSLSQPVYIDEHWQKRQREGIAKRLMLAEGLKD